MVINNLFVWLIIGQEVHCLNCFQLSKIMMTKCKHKHFLRIEYFKNKLLVCKRKKDCKCDSEKESFFVPF